MKRAAVTVFFGLGGPGPRRRDRLGADHISARLFQVGNSGVQAVGTAPFTRAAALPGAQPVGHQPLSRFPKRQCAGFQLRAVQHKGIRQALKPPCSILTYRLPNLGKLARFRNSWWDERWLNTRSGRGRFGAAVRSVPAFAAAMASGRSVWRSQVSLLSRLGRTTLALVPGRLNDREFRADRDSRSSSVKGAP